MVLEGFRDIYPRDQGVWVESGRGPSQNHSEKMYFIPGYTHINTKLTLRCGILDKPILHCNLYVSPPDPDLAPKNFDSPTADLLQTGTQAGIAHIKALLNSTSFTHEIATAASIPEPERYVKAEKKTKHR